MNTAQTSFRAVRAQVRQVQENLARDPHLPVVKRLFDELIAEARKNMKVTINGKPVVVHLDASALAWWEVHYRSLFYFAIAAKGLNPNTPKARRMMRQNARQLGQIAALRAASQLSDGVTEVTIDDHVAAWASKQSDCAPRGSALPSADFCN